MVGLNWLPWPPCCWMLGSCRGAASAFITACQVFKDQKKNSSFLSFWQGDCAGIPVGDSDKLLISSRDSPRPRGWLKQLRCPCSVRNRGVHAEWKKAEGL